MLGEFPLQLVKNFGSKLINVWSLIRPCGVEFFSEINRRVDTLIRATRVKVAFLHNLE